MSAVSVVATVEASNVPPRIKLDVTDVGTSPSIFSTTVIRLNPDGSKSTVRTPDGNPLTLVTSGSNRVGTVYDYEAPYGDTVSYSTVETPANISVGVLVPETRVWLIHPGVPSLSMPISVAEFGSRTRSANRAVYRPMGRKNAVIQTDGQRKAPEGVIEINTFTLDEIDSLETLTEDTSPLLLNVPASLGWGVPTAYISVGDIEEERLVGYAGEPRRLHRLPYVVVDAPVGGTQASRTYADLLSFSSYAALNSAYSTYGALLAGP